MSHINDLGYLLHHVSSALDHQSDVVLQEKIGVGFAQVKILMVLRENGGVTQKFIADFLGQSEASISRQVKLMQRDGLVEVRPSPKNRREHLVTMTKKSQLVLDKSNRVLNNLHAPVFSALSYSQRLQLLEILEAMHRETCRPDRPGNCSHI